MILWDLSRLGHSSYLFTWKPTSYNTVFSVTVDGVLALDPISDKVAPHYRAAIESVTDRPIRYVVYSHDHLDHIRGARVLAPDAEIVGHVDIPKLLHERHILDVCAPTRLVTDRLDLALGEHIWRLEYLGPNHSRTNLAVIDEKDGWVALIDVLSGGLVPFRDLPCSDFGGFMKALDSLLTMPVDTVVDGHCQPSDLGFVKSYQRYFAALVEYTAEAVELHIGRPSAGPVAATEAMFHDVAVHVVNQLRPDFGSWGAFETWAPMNASRALVYILTGE